MCEQCVLRPVRLIAVPWTVDRQTPLSMGFSRQESWSGLLFPSPEDLPNPGIKPIPPVSSALAGSFFTSNTTWEGFPDASAGKESTV